jgi:hypothetical protein
MVSSASPCDTPSGRECIDPAFSPAFSEPLTGKNSGAARKAATGAGFSEIEQQQRRRPRRRFEVGPDTDFTWPTPQRAQGEEVDREIHFFPVSFPSSPSSDSPIQID